MSVENSTKDRLRSILKHGAVQFDLHLDNRQYDLLVNFVLLIEKWNRVYNLTAVRSADEMVARHLLDSLSVLSWLPRVRDEDASVPNSKAIDVLDVGSGAGLPVIPLAIARPDLQFLSVESNGKKTRFQQQAVLELELDNVRICQERIEQVTDTATTCVSRAFSAPEKFIQAIDKNCLPNSRVIVMLGHKERLPTELPCGFKLAELVEIDLPKSETTRHIAICTR